MLINSLSHHRFELLRVSLTPGGFFCFENAGGEKIRTKDYLKVAEAMQRQLVPLYGNKKEHWPIYRVVHSAVRKLASEAVARQTHSVSANAEFFFENADNGKPYLSVLSSCGCFIDVYELPVSDDLLVLRCNSPECLESVLNDYDKLQEVLPEECFSELLRLHRFEYENELASKGSDPADAPYVREVLAYLNALGATR